MRYIDRTPGFPWEVEWSINWACNLQCFFCSTGNYDRKVQSKDTDLIARRIIEARPLFVSLSGGEPLTHPEIKEIIQTFQAASLPVNLTTNGVLLDAIDSFLVQSLNWTRVSLHSVREIEGKRLMGSDYDIQRVLANISYLRSNTDRLSVFSLITSRNASEAGWKELIMTLSDIGVSKLELGVVKLLGWAREAAMLEPRRVQDLLCMIKQQGLRHGMEIVAPDISLRKHYCMARVTSAAVFPDGSVRSCSFHSDVWGNLLLDDFLSIWTRRARLDPHCDRCRPGGYVGDSATDIGNRVLDQAKADQRPQILKET